MFRRCLGRPFGSGWQTRWFEVSALWRRVRRRSDFHVFHVEIGACDGVVPPAATTLGRPERQYYQLSDKDNPA